MQQHKFFQNIIYCLSIFIIYLTAVGCHQKTNNEGVNSSSNVELLKNSTSKKSKTTRELAAIYRSTDLGKTWSSFANGIPTDATLSGIKQDSNKVYITTDYHGVFVRSNNKDAWIPLNTKQIKGLDINCIEADGDKLVIGTLRHGTFISNDGGLKWEQSAVNIENTSIRAFIQSANKLFAGTDSGIFESNDMGNTWTHVFGQLQILGFTSMNDKIYAATQNGALMCTGNAQHWTSIYAGDALHDIANDGRFIYAMTIGQQLLKTANDGGRWEKAQNGIVWPTNFYTNEIQYVGNHVFSAQWIGIYHSSDNGNNWNILDGLPDSTAFSTLAITDLGIIAGVSIR